MKSIKHWRAALFVAASLLILAVISHSIVRAEITRVKGETFRFPVSGFDPHDIFRGRYLNIRMEDKVRHDAPYAGAWKRAYGILAIDAEGMAYVDKLAKFPPDDVPYLAVKMRRYYSYRFVPPFERYYMNEEDAPIAERILNAALREDGAGATLVLKIHNGYAVVEDLEIGGTSIHELIAATK